MLCLVCFEHVYQQVLRPMRTRELQHAQASTVMLLICSVIAGLILQDYENEASKAGLATAAILTGVGHCLFVACLLYAIGRKYLGTAKTVFNTVSSTFVVLKTVMCNDVVQHSPATELQSTSIGTSFA